MDYTCLDISTLIPHRDAMCLLDRVEEWSPRHIVCTATSHRRPDNPLRDSSGVRALCGIEYGAQAVAAHGALRSTGPEPLVRSGVLVSARDVTATRSHLNNLDGPLWVLATLVLDHEQGGIYDVVLTGGGETVMSGRLTVMMSVEHPTLRSATSTDGVT